MKNPLHERILPRRSFCSFIIQLFVLNTIRHICMNFYTHTLFKRNPLGTLSKYLFLLQCVLCESKPITCIVTFQRQFQFYGHVARFKDVDHPAPHKAVCEGDSLKWRSGDHGTLGSGLSMDNARMHLG